MLRDQFLDSKAIDRRGMRYPGSLVRNGVLCLPVGNGIGKTEGELNTSLVYHTLYHPYNESLHNSVPLYFTEKVPCVIPVVRIRSLKMELIV